MSDKQPGDYLKLLKHLDCSPQNFLMLGNSIKSDIIPVLELEAFAAHIPYHTTWAHERHEHELEHPNLLQLTTLSHILQFIN